jgi:hypothetical protein
MSYLQVFFFGQQSILQNMTEYYLLYFCTHERNCVKDLFGKNIDEYILTILYKLMISNRFLKSQMPKAY